MRPKNKAKENCSQSVTAAAATRATLNQRQAEPQAEAGAGAQSHLEEVQAKAQSQSQSQHLHKQWDWQTRAAQAGAALQGEADGARQGFPLIWPTACKSENLNQMKILVSIARGCFSFSFSFFFSSMLECNTRQVRHAAGGMRQADFAIV